MCFITESWLHDGINTGLLDPKGCFTVLRKDRKDGVLSHGGGVCVLINKNLRVIPVSISDEFVDLEVICFDLIACDTRLRFFVLYRPPNYNSEASVYMTKLVECLTRYEGKKYPTVVVGDLNLPKVNWSNYTGPSLDVYNAFLQFVTEHSYSQLVLFPTRLHNILDVILTTDPAAFGVVEPDCPIGTSDHCSIKFDIRLNAGQDSSSLSPLAHTLQYKWHVGDYESLELYLSTIDWYEVIYNNPSAEDAWMAFESVLHAAIECYVPHYVRSRPRKCRFKSIPINIVKCRNKKRRLWRYLKSNPYSSIAHVKYQDCVHQWRRLAQEHEALEEERIISASDLGVFYKFVNKRISNRSKITTIKDPSANDVADDTDIANVFNDYFASVGTESNHNIPPLINCNVPQLSDIHVHVQDVETAITKLKNNLCAGPDGLPPLFFKRVKDTIAFPLTLMFTQLLSVACVPKIWKQALITPVHKKGPTNVLTNYRPISITCVPCKLLERVVSGKIYSHLMHNNILHPEQHGFVRGKSTCTNLLESLNDWTRNFQDGFPTVVIYIDFSKAFDVVQHDKLSRNGNRPLFVKLQAIGIGGKLLEWIKNLFSI